MSVVAWKDGGKLLFGSSKEDPKPYVYCLKEQAFLGKRGRPIKTRPQLFKGLDLMDIVNPFKESDENTYKLLNHIRRYSRKYPNERPKLQTYRPYNCQIRNIFDLFALMPEASGIEKAINAGMEFEQLSQPIPKALLKFARKHELKLSNDLCEAWESHQKVLESAASVEWIDETFFKHFVTAVCSDTFCRFQHMLNRGYQMKSLIAYLHNQRFFWGAGSLEDLLVDMDDYSQQASAISPAYTRYPKYFLSEKAIVSRNYRRNQKKFDEDAFEAVRKPEWEKEFKVSDEETYHILYPKTTQEVKDEGAALNHCVAGYVKNIIGGSSHILFLRKDPEKPQITMEVRNGKVVQARGRCNRALDAVESGVRDKFQKHLDKVLASEK